MPVPPTHIPTDQELMDFLDAAAKNDCAALKQFLKTYGNAYINTQDTYGYTALMYAANCAHTAEALQLLLENGADLYEEAYGNRTALSIAEDRKIEQNATILREWPRKQAEMHRQTGKEAAEQRIQALKQKRTAAPVFKNR